MMINNMIDSGINIGKMSNDGLRQIKYWAVSLFALITRSAIQGGLDETTAYNFFDNCIMRIDKMSNTDDIVDLVIQKCITVTDMVAESERIAFTLNLLENACTTSILIFTKDWTLQPYQKNVDYPKITYHIYSRRT